MLPVFRARKSGYNGWVLCNDPEFRRTVLGRRPCWSLDRIIAVSSGF